MIGICDGIAGRSLNITELDKIVCVDGFLYSEGEISIIYGGKINCNIHINEVNHILHVCDSAECFRRAEEKCPCMKKVIKLSN